VAAVLSFVQFISDGRFRAFRSLDQSDVEPALSAAHRIWNEENCGPLYLDIVGYQTAVFLATGYGGAPASKTRATGDTPYSAVLDRLTKGVVGSGMVLGVDAS